MRSKTQRWVYFFCFLVFLLGALPWIIVLFWGDSLLGMLLFRPFCHQRLERTLVVLEHPMVVCSRCAGIYLGMMLGSVFAWPMRTYPWFQNTIVFFGICMVLEVLSQELRFHDVYHPSRFTSGVLFSFFGISWILGKLLLEAHTFTQQEKE